MKYEKDLIHHVRFPVDVYFSSGEITTMIQWCKECIGDRYDTWTYSEHNCWIFAKEEDATLFNFTWG
jgi:hypothetical protein